MHSAQGTRVDDEHLLNTLAMIVGAVGVAVIALTGCGTDIDVGDIENDADTELAGDRLDGQTKPSPLFTRPALEQFDVDERAYVVGHSFAILVYARTLPRYLVGTGFDYPAGVSSGEARVAYALDEVTEPGATAGDCVVVEGGEIPLCPDDETEPLEDGEDIDDRVDGELNPVDGEGDAADDGDPEDNEPPAQPTPEDPFIDDDCETFLDPAAVEARQILSVVPPQQVLRAAGFTQAQLTPAVLAQYELGRADALAIEDLDEDTDHSEVETIKPLLHDAEICDHSPLVLDMNGDGIEAGDPADGVLFDLKEVGAPVRTAWPSGSDPLVVMDRDGDGLITHGGELFGNSRTIWGERRANGFAALAELDDNLDGFVDAKDPRFDELMLWRDLDRDGVSDPGELSSLDEHRVTALATSFVSAIGAKDAAGNDTRMRGVFWRRAPDGALESGTMIDVWFRVQSAVQPLSRR